MFKNLRFFRLTSAWLESEQDLAESLSAFNFKPCEPLVEKSSGWEPPVTDSARTLSRRVDGADLLQLRSQSRILPASAINEALEARVDEYRERLGEEPSGREKRRLKELTRDSLLPKALLRSERTKGLMLLSDSIFGIDAATPAKAERFLEYLRAPLGSVDTVPLTFKRSISELLTRVFLGDAPDGITLGQECRMQDPSDSRSRVHWADMDLTANNIRKHVRDGMRVTQLGIVVDSVMSCVIDENGALGKVRFLGMDAADEIDGEDPLARFDAEFVLLTGTLRQLLRILTQALGGIDSRS
jgi:recombination associated protein RdgC